MHSSKISIVDILLASIMDFGCEPLFLMVLGLPLIGIFGGKTCWFHTVNIRVAIAIFGVQHRVLGYTLLIQAKSLQHLRSS